MNTDRLIALLALHLRQIAKRRFELIGAHSEPYHTGYGGEWTA